MKKIATITDTLINVDYTLVSINSSELAKSLKDNLDSKSIDYNKFNRESSDKDSSINLPTEVYEYQNFFLLEKENGELILLDGFRRLLWNKTVSHTILVRVYKEKDMSSLSILKLLVALNHTKFFAGIGSFYDRGFALGMYVIFGVDITKIYQSFNGYLTVNKPEYSYSISRLNRESAHTSTLDKVSNISFIEDMKFLETLQKADVIEMDDVFGSYISHIRQANPEIVLDANVFISKIISNPVLVKQIESFKKSKDSRGNDIGNKMFEMFTNILLDKVGEKSFAERVAEIKEGIANMKKDKSWFNYTGNKKYSFHTISNMYDKNGVFYQTKGVEGAIKDYYDKNGKFPTVKVFVLPNEKPLLNDGIYDDFEIKEIKEVKKGIYTYNIIIVQRGDIILKKYWKTDNTYDLSNIEHGWGGDKKYNDIVLFVKDLNFEL